MHFYHHTQHKCNLPLVNITACDLYWQKYEPILLPVWGDYRKVFTNSSIWLGLTLMRHISELADVCYQTEWCLQVCKNLEQLHTKQSLRSVHMTHWSCANMTWTQCILMLKSWHEWWRFNIILHLTMVKCIQSYSVYVNVESMCRLFDLISCNCTGWHVVQDYFCCPEARRKS